MPTLNASPDGIREERLREMEPDLRTMHHALWNHVVELHGELDDFRTLYASPGATAVLHEVAGQFFETIRKVLWEHVLLYVARLTDRPDTFGHSNLTLLRLPMVIANPALKQQIDALLHEAAPAWEPIRELRDKWLAHLDLLVATGDPDAARLTNVDFEAVDKALSSMGDVLSKVEARYLGPADRRYVPIRPLGSAKALLFWLRRAVKEDARRRERLLVGRPRPEDLERDDG